MKAQAQVKKAVRLQLEMDEAQAKLLMAMVQNPIGYEQGRAHAEPEPEKEIRHAIFDALKDALGG